MFTNCVLGDVVGILKDRYGIEVLLVVKKNIHSTLLKVIELKFVRHLTEKWTLFVEERENIQNL